MSVGELLQSPSLGQDQIGTAERAAGPGQFSARPGDELMQLSAERTQSFGNGAGSSTVGFRALSIRTHERNGLLNEPELESAHFLPSFVPGHNLRGRGEREEPPKKTTLVNLSRHKFQLNQRHNS